MVWDGDIVFASGGYPKSETLAIKADGSGEVLWKNSKKCYEQSMLAWRMLNEIPGVSCVKPRGALYCFPRLDPAVYPIDDDEKFVIDLLRAEKILVTHGTGFNWFAPDHFRLVTLPDVDTLTEAIGRISNYLARYRLTHSSARG